MQHNSIPRALEKKLFEKIGILDSAQINYYYAVSLVMQAVGSFFIVYMHAGVRLVYNTSRKQFLEGINPCYFTSTNFGYFRAPLSYIDDMAKLYLNKFKYSK